MKIKLTIFCLMALFTLAATTYLSAAEASPIPKKLSAYIGGFNGPTYLVELHDGVLTYTSGSRSAPEHTKITPTDAQWREFRQSLDAFEVWKWHSDYSKLEVLDGTQWRFNLEYTDHTLKTKGSNDYPKDFDRYLAAIEKLLSGKTFR